MILWKCYCAKNQRVSWNLSAFRRRWKSHSSHQSNASTVRSACEWRNRKASERERESRASITHRSGESSWDRTEKKSTLPNLCHSNKYVAHMKNVSYRVELVPPLCVSTHKYIRFAEYSIQTRQFSILLRRRWQSMRVRRRTRRTMFVFLLHKCVCVSLREHSNEEPTTHSHRIWYQ